MFVVFTIDESHFGICNNHFHRLECRDHSQKLLSLLLLVSTASPPQTTAPRAEHFRTMDHFITDTVPYFTISVSFILCDPEQSFILWSWSRLVVSLFCFWKSPITNRNGYFLSILSLATRAISSHTGAAWRSHVGRCRRRCFWRFRELVTPIYVVICLKHCKRHNGPGGWVLLTASTS